jgi:glycosyltransferase involved in cell wall biosynthesis
VIFQGRSQWEVDQHELLTSAQRARPRIYLEHDPPQEHPTDTRHFVDDRGTLLVHVTPFNALMWDSGRTPSLVIDHGVTVPDGVACTGELARAIAVVDDIAARGRHLGMDVLDTVRADVPVDLAGAGSLDAGGIGEVPHDRLHAFVARYRVFFNPSRYTSLDLAVCEAMMLGQPIVGLATTEMATAIERGVSGYVDTDPRVLAEMLRHLLAHPEEARRLGANARRYARERFNIDRFVRDWNSALAWVTGPVASPRSLASGVPS